VTVIDKAAPPPARPGLSTGEFGHPRRWLILAVLLTGAFLLPVDFSIVNVALPSIRAGLDASGGELQLIIAGYAVAFAVLLITGGRLGDLYGRKTMFLAGMACFIFASALCGLAWNIHVLIAARLVQGVAAAMLQPQVLASIRVIFPPAERNRALGLYGATMGLGVSIGQLIGGVLIGLHPFGTTWQSIFLVNLPVGALDLAAAFWLLPRVPRLPGVRLDLAGVAVLSLGLGLLVYPLVVGGEQGWPGWTLVCLAASVPVLVGFVWLERRLTATGQEPLLDMRLFANRGFAVGMTLELMVYSSSGFFFTYAVYLQSGMGWDVMEAGLAILPFGLGFLSGSLSVPTLVAKIGLATPRLGYVAGMFGQGGVILILRGGGGPGPAMFACLACAGVGLGLVFPSLLRIVLLDIRPDQAGMASGALNTAIQIGPAIAVPVIGGVFFRALGDGGAPALYQHAFAAALACIVATHATCLALTFLLRRSRPAVPS
jgi:EmrB/QacA subfamily drug resistance transporter